MFLIHLEKMIKSALKQIKQLANGKQCLYTGLLAGGKFKVRKYKEQNRGQYIHKKTTVKTNSNWHNH